MARAQVDIGRVQWTVVDLIALHTTNDSMELRTKRIDRMTRKNTKG